MPYSSRACFITPSLFQLHNVQHHTPAAPFLSIADNIAAVYQKRKAKKYLANHYKLAGIKQRYPHKSTKEPFGFYSNHHSACDRCELVTLEIYFLESL